MNNSAIIGKSIGSLQNSMFRMLMHSDCFRVCGLGLLVMREMVIFRDLQMRKLVMPQPGMGLQNSFSLRLGPITIKPYRLNYRPEDTATYVRAGRNGQPYEALSLPSNYPCADSPWLNLVQHHGQQGLTEAYHMVLEGRVRPQDGHIITPG